MKTHIATICLLLCSATAWGEITFQFKDPSFTSNGWATQVFAVGQQEQSAKAAIKAQQEAKEAQAKADAANTPLAKFMSLFQSEVYAQLATQLSNNLFSGTSTSNTGSFVLAGNTITYVKSTDNVQLTVVDQSGNKTVVNVPIAQFQF
jgi:Type VIII secretion system (T8SS), CsgF protein